MASLKLSKTFGIIVDCLNTVWKWIKRGAKAFHEGMKSFEFDFFYEPVQKYRNPFKERLKQTQEEINLRIAADFAVTLLKLNLADEVKDKQLLYGSHRYLLAVLAKQAGIQGYDI